MRGSSNCVEVFIRLLRRKHAEKTKCYVSQGYSRYMDHIYITLKLGPNLPEANINVAVTNRQICPIHLTA